MNNIPTTVQDIFKDGASDVEEVVAKIIRSSKAG